jgi:hypothetical protein
MNACAKWSTLSLIVSLALTACGKSGEPKSSSGGTTEELTQYQRDSMLSTSRIPGAAGVGAAMRAADATSRGIRAADTVSP